VTVIRSADAVRIGVNVRAWVRHRGGRWQLHDAGHNLVADAGLNMLRDRLRGVNVVAPLGYFAVGTGSTPPIAGDLALENEVFRDVFTQVTFSSLTMVVRYFLGPNDANGNTLREVGLFNAPSGPDIFARRVLDSPINKDIDTAATFEWTVSLAAV
jgi:hypothetical protein